MSKKIITVPQCFPGIDETKCGERGPGTGKRATNSILELKRKELVQVDRSKNFKSNAKETAKMLENIALYCTIPDQARIYSEEQGLRFVTALIDWYSQNENVLFFSEYWFVNPYDGFFSYNAIKKYRKYDSFNELYDYLQELQKNRLQRFAIMGLIPTNIAVFFLKNYHGLSDKIEQTVTHTSNEIQFKFGGEDGVIDISNTQNEQTQNG